MKKILLLGDSIRLSYREKVASILENKATIIGPNENCRFSAFTLFNISNWAKDDDYDIIQWNNGQWDTCYMADGKIHIELPQYLENLERIASVLKSKTKRLIFATTTPVWDEMITEVKIHPRKNEEIVAYNNAAAERLSKLGVEINDLHSIVYENIKKYICEDMVHLNEDGVNLLGEKVANAFMN
jgi:hypothetical protein